MSILGKIKIAAAAFLFLGPSIGGTAALKPAAATLAWTTTRAMPQTVYRHTASLLPSGQVLVAGGTDGRGA